MKKLFIAIILLTVLTNLNIAQATDKAIGIRGLSNSAEISFQNSLSKSTRLELDLGLYGLDDRNGFILTGIHQWVFGLDKGLN